MGDTVGFVAFQSAVAWGFFPLRSAGIFAIAFLKWVNACLSSAGTVFVVLLCVAGLTAKAQAQELAPPTITNVSPNTGPPSGDTSVTITGTNFSGATAVRFGNTAAASFTVNSATQITATSPAGIGTVDVTVTTPGGTSATNSADQFTYTSAPTVTGISPNTGPPSGGTSVTITGTNFSGATAVRFGNTAAASFTVNSATQITATSPAGIGTVDVTVTTPGGTSATNSADQFTYTSAPTVTGISPNTGPPSGSTSVTITGTNFSGATAVRFGNTAAASFTVNSATQITATSPAGIGTVDVTVTTPGGTSATNSADQFTYTSAPTVTGISPNTGPPSGGTSVTITGTNFSGATAVKFGNTAAASFTVNSATQITATSPAGIGTVDVTVTTPGGTSATNSADQFTYGPVQTIVALASSQNPSQLGQSVTFTVKVTGLSPTGTVSLFDRGRQIGIGTLAAGTATFTISSLVAGSHSITAQYGGDHRNTASTSVALIQAVNIPTDSIKLRQMQVSVTPLIAQMSGQAIVGAVDTAIASGFNDNPQSLTPNGAGFTFQIALGQPPAAPIGSSIGIATGNGVRISTSGRIALGQPVAAPNGNIGTDTRGRVRIGAGSLANGGHGGNGAPLGRRLIDMPIIPLPPRSGMPPIGETRFSPDEVVFQFANGTPPQEIAKIAERFSLTIVEQQDIGMLGRSVYTFRIVNGQSVRQVIGRVEAARLRVAVQPNYTYRLTQDQSNPIAGLGDPAQYIVNKFHLAEVHRINKGDKVVIAVIDSEIELEPTQSRRHDQRPVQRGLRSCLPRSSRHWHGRRDRVPRTAVGRRPACKYHRDLRFWWRRPAVIELDQNYQGTQLCDPARR